MSIASFLALVVHRDFTQLSHECFFHGWLLKAMLLNRDDAKTSYFDILLMSPSWWWTCLFSQQFCEMSILTVLKLARRKMYPRSSIQKEVVWGLRPMLVLTQISASWNSIIASILHISPKTRPSSITLVVASFQIKQRQESSSYQVLKVLIVSELSKCQTSVKYLRMAPGRGLTPPKSIPSPSPASELALDCI